MDHLLRPSTFDVEPSATGATKRWLHWHCTFKNLMSNLTTEQQNCKLQILINYISPTVYEYISECATYDDAIATLTSIYNKPKNIIFARHLLATCKQDGHTFDQYLQTLKTLAKDCDFKDVTALQYKDDCIRDAFIAGLSDGRVRQRLLEKESLDLQQAYDTARSLELAQKQSLSYQSAAPSLPFGATAAVVPSDGDNPT